MSERDDERAALADPGTRLGQLQRGTGRGFRQALADGAAAVDDVLGCVLHDPRVDAQLERRDRYFVELVQRLAVPVEAIFAGLRGRDTEALGSSFGLGHEVLAGLFRVGDAATRRRFAVGDVDESTCRGVGYCLQDLRVRLVDLPACLRGPLLEVLLDDADCVVASRRGLRRGTPEASLSVAQLLDRGRGADVDPRAVLRELCCRTEEGERRELLACVEQDVVHGRVALAAKALGTMGDERLLPLCEDYFAREDVFEDPARRLSGFDRMRRAALAVYARHLPDVLQLRLARLWYGRGRHFDVVAGHLFAAQATDADRERMERAVAEGIADGSEGWNALFELDALGRCGDARSVELLLEVVTVVGYAQARRRALHALALLVVEGAAPQAVPQLREALWDCEDEAVADAAAFLPHLDDAARARARALAAHPLFDDDLRAGLRRRCGDGTDSAHEA